MIELNVNKIDIKDQKKQKVKRIGRIEATSKMNL